MAPRRKKHPTYKLPLELDLLQKLAPLLAREMYSLVTADHEMHRTSGIWRKGDGTLTARFVFQSKAGNRRDLVLTVRNIRQEWFLKGGA
jgi:hypothetical protein